MNPTGARCQGVAAVGLKIEGHLAPGADDTTHRARLTAGALHLDLAWHRRAREDEHPGGDLPSGELLGA